MSTKHVHSQRRDDPWSIYTQMPASEDMRKRVGERIRVARVAKGLSQSALARELPGGSEGRDVSRWERGQNMPSWPNLQAIAGALDLTVADLLADGDDEPEAA
jgi:transcriptional regulator with XRE-family HTH domain